MLFNNLEPETQFCEEIPNKKILFFAYSVCIQLLFFRKGFLRKGARQTP